MNEHPDHNLHDKGNCLVYSEPWMSRWVPVQRKQSPCPVLASLYHPDIQRPYAADAVIISGWVSNEITEDVR